MSEINISHQCTGCGVCVTVCPSKCLTMQADQEGFLYPRVNKKNCVNCNLCKQICPVNNCQQTYINVDKKELCIYAVSANDQYVKNASSGGAFPELAQFFLQQGGAVIGVAFNENFEAVLKIIENSNQLPELMQAKYVQATIPEDLYSQALTILNSGRLLLFTGTPCQIAAFKSYCKNKKFSNLLCAEIICHGVPSPAVWQSYLEFVKKTLCSPIKAIYFRDKSINWHKFALRIDCKKEQMIQFHKKNPYMQLFLKELISRKSCTNCLFKCGKSSADLSLGDFWNLHKVAPHLDNSTGASMIIVHTELGFSVLQKCKWIHFETLPFDYVKTSNKAYFESMQANPLRDKYFAEFSASGKNWFSPDEYIQKKRKENFFKKIIKKLRGCLCYVK